MPITVRPVLRAELRETVEIYLECLRADYSFKPRPYLEGQTVEDNLAECEAWLYSSGQPNRIFGAFEDGRMLGYIAVGPNIGEPAGYAGEVNGLFVRPDCRERGLGLMLLQAGLKDLRALGYASVIIYNYRMSRANSYYEALGGERVYFMVQHPGGMALDTDVFGWQIDAFLDTLAQRLKKYSDS